MGAGLQNISFLGNPFNTCASVASSTDVIVVPKHHMLVLHKVAASLSHRKMPLLPSLLDMGPGAAGGGRLSSSCSVRYSC